MNSKYWIEEETHYDVSRNILYDFYPEDAKVQLYPFLFSYKFINLSSPTYFLNILCHKQRCFEPVRQLTSRLFFIPGFILNEKVEHCLKQS